MTKLIVALGADSAGAAMKNALRERLSDNAELELRDFGVPDDTDATDYPYIGLAVAEAVARGEAQRAILVCGTGIGMAIAANKVPGIRATVAHDSYSVERSVLSNDCQVLALGGRVIGVELALRLAEEWLGYTFDPHSASARKVCAIADYEERRPDGANLEKTDP